MSSFSDPVAVANYAANPPKLVPGFADLQRMAALLLAERIDGPGRVLVLGAGGGLELKVFAQMYADWTFVGVDPSAEMLDLARQMTAEFERRIVLHEGYIDTAPSGPFDGATCLLTLHFLPREERLRTLVALRTRIKPGGHLVVAHHSYPQDDEGKALWLGRFAEFATSNGVAMMTRQRAIETLGAKLPALSPDDDEALLVEAGFTKVELFYTALTFRGWVATA